MNNGSVMGFLYQDNVNTSLSHTESYTYDSLNRLSAAVATGNSTYNFTFNYDRYGNMTCTVNGQTQGLCPQYSFNPANNRISGFSYDAAGDQLSDATYTYQYDAEHRIATILEGSSTFEELTYNAHGQAVGEMWPVYNNDAQVGLFSPAGRELGYYDTVSDNWYDRDIWVAGRMVAQSFAPGSWLGGVTQYLHANVLHSDTQVTNQAGTSTLDILYYPWGQYWTHAGYESDSHFAGFQQSGGPNYPTPTRTYAGGQGRWLTPDPENAGADTSNPQAWNAYSYAGNNPTTNTDPSGLYCVKDANGSLHDVGNEGESCADVRESNAAEAKHPSVTVTGKPGDVAEAVAANVGIGVSNLMIDNANTFSSMLTIGQYSPNFPHIPAGSGVAANIGAIAPLVGLAFVAPEGDAEEIVAEGTATVEDILRGAVSEGGSRSQIVSKSGGIGQAERDFKSLAGHEEISGPVRYKDLPGGGRAVLRTDPSTFTTDGRPGLDIQPSGGGYKEISIRYN